MDGDSVHFRLEEVAPGVWVALAGESGACAANAGIIGLGDHTLVFDTFMTPEAGDDLRSAAERRTHRPVSLVINSHHHEDHVRGNQAFGGIPILATARTATLIAETHPNDLEAYAAELRRLADRDLDGEAEPMIHRDVERSRATARAVLASLPDLSLTPPTETLTGDLVIEGSQRNAHIISMGGGHSESDTIVFLPDVSVVFAGDLLSVENHPWAGDGDPDEWVNIIYRMKALGPEVVVPGHGTVTKFEYARIFTRYLTFVCDMVKQAEATSTPLIKLVETPVPPQYAEWTGLHWYRATLEALGRRAGLPPD